MKPWPLALVALAGCAYSSASSAPSPGLAARPTDSAAPPVEPPPDWHAAPASSEPFASSPACSADEACGWARCHRAGRCAFPCVADGDCRDGARCEPAPGNASVLVCTAAASP